MKAFYKWFAGLVVLFGITVIATVIANETSQRRAANNRLEFKEIRLDKAVNLVQGLKDKVRFVLDGKTYDQFQLIHLEIFNRTSAAVSEVPLRIKLKGGDAQLVSKMLLYPHDEDEDRFEWKDPGLSDLNVNAHSLNLSWNEEPLVSFNLIFAQGQLPDIEVFTSKAGVFFDKFDESKTVWFLFGYDNVLIPAAILFGFALFFVTMITLGNSFEKRQEEAFSRVMGKTLGRYWTQNNRIEFTKVIVIAWLVHKLSLKRLRLSEKYDPKIEDEILEKILGAEDKVKMHNPQLLAQDLVAEDAHNS